jgi:hypothetical protein
MMFSETCFGPDYTLGGQEKSAGGERRLQRASAAAGAQVTVFAAFSNLFTCL